MHADTSGNKKVTLHTTFSRLREANACTEGYRKLAKHLGGVEVYGADTPINLLTILESNGVADALWSLRAADEWTLAVGVARRLAIQFAERVLPIYEKRVPNDSRPRDAIIAAKRFLAGEIELETLLKARRAAAYAADAADADAAYAAYAAAYADAADAADAAADAADAAAYAAADAAAYAAADAAYAAAYAAADAAYAAARTAERAEQAQMILAALAFDEVTA